MCGFGTRATGNYDAPDIAVRDERPGDEHHPSYELVAVRKQSGTHLIWR